MGAQCFCVREQKKHQVYIVFLRSGTNCAPGRFRERPREVRPNSLAASKNPMRTAVWGIYLFAYLFTWLYIYTHIQVYTLGWSLIVPERLSSDFFTITIKDCLTIII